MIPLVTAIEDLDAILPEDAQITWDQGRDADFALLIESGRASYRFAIDSDTLLQRGEAYRKFLVGIARVLGVMAVELMDRRNPERRRAAALQEAERRQSGTGSSSRNADDPSFAPGFPSLATSTESPAA